MVFRNNVKYLTYKTLLDFKKSNDMHATQKFIIDKYNLEENYFGFIIDECIHNHYLDGIVSSKSLNNHFSSIYKKHIYLTYNGYEFLKNYYSTVKKILWNIFLALSTAIITVNVNNWLNNTNQTHNQECQTYTNE